MTAAQDGEVLHLWITTINLNIMFAKIKNNQPIEWPILNLSQLFPRTSFPVPITDSDLPEGYVIVHPGVPPQIDETQKLVPSSPIFRDNKWVQNWVVEDLSTQELEEYKNIKASSIRLQRNTLLAECDWTQVSDSPVNREVWATYRQALRDITAQISFPLRVEWPVAPTLE